MRRWLCVTCGLFMMLAGCSSKVTLGLNIGRVSETRGNIDEVIAEPERRAQAQAIVDALIASAAEHSARLKAICSEKEWEDIFDHEDDVVNFTF